MSGRLGGMGAAPCSLYSLSEVTTSVGLMVKLALAATHFVSTSFPSHVCEIKSTDVDYNCYPVCPH